MTEIRCEIFDGEAEIVGFTSDGGRELVFRIEGGADGFVSMDGVAALFTNVDVKQLCKTLIKENINAKVSNSAGLFVCNRLYYEALLMCKENPGMKALFVHLPLYEGQSSAENEKPCMPLDDMVKALGKVCARIENFLK